MKGTITRCLADMVTARWGAVKWGEIVQRAGIPSDDISLLLPTANVDDRDAVALFESTASALGMTAEATADAFGQYWCCTYAPSVYRAIVSRFKSAREMILAMDEIHVHLTRTIPNARPPRFDYRWLNDNTLEVTYKSPRNLIHIYAGLARGVGKYFNEPVAVTVLGSDKVRIDFG